MDSDQFRSGAGGAHGPGNAEPAPINAPRLTGDVRAEPIAVIGIGCHFPGGVTDPQSYWRLLEQGVDAITETPPDRWSLQRFYAPGGARPAKTQSRWGGYVDGIDRFDPQLFGISPKEAASMDPQQRMLLEVTWRALEDAGQPINTVAGRSVGVFTGVSSFDYAIAGLSFQDRGAINSYSSTGGASSIAANRVSYCFDLRGPSLAVDTACSSSLVALHLACESLRCGESEMALAGGVNALILPDYYVAFSQLGVLSPDGRCKTFDARANGYVRSEGAGMVLLKPLSKAIRDNDPIYCVIRGTALNQDGHTPGLTIPSGDAQQALVRAACRKAGVDPREIHYVEAHGTGTPVGDPIEANALSAVLCEHRDSNDPCLIGSVKTNIGHLEACAGMASVIKVALSIHHGKIPSHLHLSEPHPEINFDELKLQVPHQTLPWPSNGRKRLAGVNGFGYGGANAHVLIGEAPAYASGTPSSSRNGSDRQGGTGPFVLPVSARSGPALAAHAEQVADWLEKDSSDRSLPDIAASAAHRRSHFEYRHAVVGNSRDDWADGLRSLANDSTESSSAANLDAGILFACCGQGTQWWAMGRGLYESNPTFRKQIERADGEFSRHVTWSLKEELCRDEADSRQHETSIAQPTLFALQVALCACWADVGVRPSAIVGHSVGEIAAAYLSGALSFEDACLVAVERGRTMDLASSRGAMIAAGISAGEALDCIDKLDVDVSLAAINGPASVTLSGESEAVELVARHLESERVFCKRLAVQYAFHSSQMQPVRSALLRSLAGIRPRPTNIDMISTVTGERLSGEEVDAEYWWRNVRECVQFSDAMSVAADRGFELAIELGPHPVLTYSINECYQDTGRPISVVPSIRRDQADARRFAQSIADVYNVGAEIDWTGIYQQPDRITRLPPYPFQRQTLWYESAESRTTRLSPSHPLLGEPTDHPGQAWRSRIDLTVQTSLGDHQVRGNCMLPAAAMIEISLAAARRIEPNSGITLGRCQFHRPCLLADRSPVYIETSYQPDRRELSLSSRDVDNGSRDVDHENWSPLASATLLRDARPIELLARSLDDVQRRCEEVFDAEECYDYCEKLGLEYGPAFRGLVHGRRRDGEALATIRLDQLDDNLGYQHGIHPAILDSCFHSMIAADASFDHTVGGLYLPREVERIQFVRPATPEVHVHVRLIRKTDKQLVADLDVLDTQGRPCLLLRGFVSERAGRGEDEESLSDLLYAYRWNEKSIEDEGIVSIEKATSRVWCVFAGQGPLSSLLCDALEDQGGRVVRLEHGTQYRHLSDNHFVLNPECKDDFDRCLRDAVGEVAGSETHFVYLWGLDAADPEHLSPTSLQESTILTSLAPLHLTQAWDDRHARGPARLTVVTTGTQSLHDGDESVAVAQLPLIGFGRVIISEFSGFRTQLVDLPARRFDAGDEGKPTDCSHTLNALIDELTTDGDSEDEVMYRNGRRYVHRFAPRMQQPIPLDASTSMQCRLGIGQTHGIDELRHYSKPPATVGPHDVEIRIEASGLNFSDVMKTLRLYPGLEDKAVSLGAECSGCITRVGSEVTDWETGDQVIAVAPGAFATHVVVGEALIARKPANLTHEEAATIPIAFLTAAHALEDCARMSQGESVLIHAASGGVGLAAMQLAQLAGAKVYATAGSEKKREYVREQGAALVMDSRSLRFADQIMEETSGEGVDIVLNSLPGDAIARGLQSLKVGGRFLEIGKRDIYDDSSLGLYPFRNNLALFAIDLDQLFKTRARQMGEKLRDLVCQFEQGRLKPLPVEVWDADESDAAFRFMQQAKHIGKVAIRYSRRPAEVYPGEYDPIEFRADGTYLIVGGLGGFGLQIARWIGQRGGGTLVLSGRSGKPDTDARKVIQELESAGVSVYAVPADVTDPVAVDGLMQRIDDDLPPLRGVIHSAMVLEDRLLVDLDRDTLERVLQPKVLGGWNLHQATKDRDLDHFILFSSLSSVFGHAGQANYAAANALLDGLAYYRRQHGLPACVINWGHLGEVGYLAQRDELSERLRRQGVLSFTVDQATQSLEHALRSHVVQMSVLRMDWSVWRGLGITGDVSPRFAHLLRNVHASDALTASADELREAAPSDRRNLVEQMLRSRVASLLGLGEAQLEARRSMLELGLDSLMAVELRNWIESQIKIELPISELMRGASLEDLINIVCSIVDEQSAEPVEAIDDAPDNTDERDIDPGTAKEILGTLSDLPQQDVQLLLDQMLRQQESRTK